MEAYDWRCLNCGGFHGDGACQCYDQRWENQPNNCWEGDDDFNLWNPPYHQYYGAYKHQPLEQEEPQQGLGSGKKSMEELREGFMTRTENIYKNQEASIKNLKIQFQKLSRQFMEVYQISPPSEEVISLEEQGEELHMEEKEACELIEESLIPRALEKDEVEECPKEVSADALELEFDNTVGEQEEQVFECEKLKEVPIVDFVFGDKLRIGEEKLLSIS